jgi:hypothetical protein
MAGAVARPGLLLVVAVLLGGCYQSYQDFPGVGVDARTSDVVDSVADDGDTRVEVDAHGDAPDADADTGSDGDVVACTGGWFDPVSGLCWQEPPYEEVEYWWAAVGYCDGISLGGYGPGSWHLPTITELRSLIRGCPATMILGACSVIESCLDYSCGLPPCDGCPREEGPGVGGCYWDTLLAAHCGFYWSSSDATGLAEAAWAVRFDNGSVGVSRKAAFNLVRCVRHAP